MRRTSLLALCVFLAMCVFMAAYYALCDREAILAAEHARIARLVASPGYKAGEARWLERLARQEAAGRERIRQREARHAVQR